MLQHLGVKLAKWLLSRGNLNMEDSVVLTTAILDTLGALPYKDVIAFNKEGSLIVEGKTLTLDQARHLQESALAALKNSALSLICEQIRFKAVVYGVHKGETPTQILWGRAGIWSVQNIYEALSDLAQIDNGSNL